MQLRVKQIAMPWYKRPTTQVLEVNVPYAGSILYLGDAFRVQLVDFGMMVAKFMKENPEGEIRITRS